MLRLWLKASVVLWLAHVCVRAAAASLYTEEDPLVILGSGSLRSTITNSSSAWLLQFFSSWCGHCIQYSSTWKELAEDVKGTGSGLDPNPGPARVGRSALTAVIAPFVFAEHTANTHSQLSQKQVKLFSGGNCSPL